MARDVTTALKIPAMLGEGPRWHISHRCLYWVDIARNELHRFDPASGENRVRRFDQPVGCFAFCAHHNGGGNDGDNGDGGFLLAMKNGCAWLADMDAEPVPFGPQILQNKPRHRFNDGRTDARGRFWIGTMNEAKDVADAALYRLDGDGILTEIEGGMLTCNAAAFSADGRLFTHADTPSHALRIYDVTAQGDLANRRILHQFPHGQGRPDGGSFDAEGCYWSALFDGGRVVRINQHGAIIETVPLPVSRPTMICFGGPDLKTAYVTSARIGLDDDALAAQPDAGSIFSFRVDVPGLAEHSFHTEHPFHVEQG